MKIKDFFRKNYRFQDKYELDKKVGFDIIGNNLLDQKKEGYWVYRAV